MVHLIPNINRNIYLLLLVIVTTVFLVGCSSTRPYILQPIKTFDPDTAFIPQPEENESYQYWDRIDNTVFHQLEKPLDLNRTFRFAGRLVGVAGSKQADNVNYLDEVPESSWYNYRHYHNPMSPEELARGPNTATPDTSGTWTIFSAKLEGANPGFFIEDSIGNRFLIKFDGPKFPELTTSAEVISTKFFHAAGYNVPEATITYFDPDKVAVGEEVTVVEKGKTRPMTMADYRKIVANKPRNESGKIRALASKFVDGIPVGTWAFEGKRKDDPNDRVSHEHRRELRGMRILSSWLNDTDRRDANTMAVYSDERYIKHYVQDFGNTLGANGAGIHMPIYGQAYLVDPRYMALNLVSLGMNVNNWEDVNEQVYIRDPSVGYFRADVFKPGRWVSAHPLPAYENMTLRDAFWGARLVMSFSDEDIRAIVETGRFSDPGAEDYVAEILMKRRDKIGRYWFSRINPIDKFEVGTSGDKILLGFTDPGVRGDLYSAGETYYEYSVRVFDGKTLVREHQTQTTRIPIDRDAISGQSTREPIVLEYEIITRRKKNKTAEKSTFVYVLPGPGDPRIVGITREE